MLLIDDDEAVLQSLGRLLAKRCDVTMAHDGSEGLAHILAPGARWDLILCDLKMPVMNGIELYRRVEGTAPQFVAAFVFLSGGATTPETFEFLSETRRLMLAKPADVQRIYALIAERVAASAS